MGQESQSEMWEGEAQVGGQVKDGPGECQEPREQQQLAEYLTK